MAKVSKVQQAIDRIESEIAVLVAARDRLVRERDAEKPKARKPLDLSDHDKAAL